MRGGFGRGISPVKMLLKGTIPAFVKSKLASSGTSGADGTMVCPLLAKKFKNSARMSISWFEFIKNPKKFLLS